MLKPISRKDIIRQGWESYREKVIPKDAGETQLVECERVFFAGSSWLFSAMLTLSDEGDDLSENDEALFLAIEKELNDYPVFDQLRFSEPKGSA